jgi:hypothetical protein
VLPDGFVHLFQCGALARLAENAKKVSNAEFRALDDNSLAVFEDETNLAAPPQAQVRANFARQRDLSLAGHGRIV